MADERLRALERAWKETGDEGLGARYLLERSRSGALPERGLELAAWLGLDPARQALERLGRPTDEQVATLGTTRHDAVRLLIRELGLRFGFEVCARVGLAVAESVTPDYQTLFPDEERVRAALDAVAAWLGDPTPATRAACSASAEGARLAHRAALAQFQAWGIEFSHQAASFGREGEPGGEDLEELVHDAGQDDFDGFNLCHDRHFDVAFFQVPGLAEQLALSTTLEDPDEAISVVSAALGQVTELAWEQEFESGYVFDEAAEGLGESPVEVNPDPLLTPTQLFELARSVLLAWALNERVDRADADPGDPVVDAWEAHLEAFPQGLGGLRSWCEALRPFGQALGARVAAAAARRCLAVWETPWDQRPHAAIAAALTWSSCPCQDHASECERAIDDAVEAMDSSPRVAEAAARAAEVALAGADDWHASVLAALEAATDEISLKALKDALRASFDAWALGLEPEQPV